VGTKSEASHAANNVARKVKKHASGKDVWQTCNLGPPGRLTRQGMQSIRPSADRLAEREKKERALLSERALNNSNNNKF